MNRSLESVFAVFGIMQAGGAFVPLDPKLPQERIEFVVQDCQIRYLICHPGLEDKVSPIVAELSQIKAILGLKLAEFASYSWENLGEMPELSPDQVNILEQDLAYVMYTSGSTGQPKGIMHSHYSGLSYARLSVDLYRVLPEDRVCSHSPLHYDISTFGYFSSPLAGATSIILPEAYTMMPASLSQLMETEKLSIWYSVPLALIQLQQRGVLEKRNLASLRWVLFGGEPFPPKVLGELMKVWPQAQFSNVYGPAEVNQCTFYTIPEIPKDDQAIPLGQAWDNTEIILLNEKDEEVTGQEIGEILVRSATQMRAYWNRPTLSEAAFFIREPHPGFIEKFYRTGDLARFNEKSELLFLGRKDRQIKIRGYRVELTEVETILMQQI
ncbi:MAG: AMP-binding protein, partial [Bacteroidota bacterium]